MKELRQELMKLQGEKRSMVEHSRLQKEMSQVQQQVVDLKGTCIRPRGSVTRWRRSYRFGGMSDV